MSDIDTEAAETIAALIAKHGDDAATVHELAGAMVHASIDTARKLYREGGRTEAETIDLMIGAHEHAAHVLRKAQRHTNERTQS